MGKGQFYVCYEPENGILSGKAGDVARDMKERGAFLPTGWVEVVIWGAAAMFGSTELSKFLGVESWILRAILWPVTAVILFAASRLVLFVSAWITSKKNAQDPNFRQSLRQYIWFGEDCITQSQRIPGWRSPTAESPASPRKRGSLS